MARLKLAGQAGALDVAASVAQFQEQIAALNDLMRQVAGDAAISAGGLQQADPLNAPFTLYVNPYTGSDKFVGGSYNTHESGANDEEIIASKLKRIEKQRLTCGYTPQRPFKTINRAVIEAAIITSKEWYTYTDPRAHVDCVSIVLAPAVHTLYTDPGSSSTSLASWGEEKDPSVADLIAFNPATVGGVLLPRGCSLCGPDLRKTTVRPSWVPGTADEAADYSNRRGMLKITGTGYFFGFTVMDKVGENRSHHLLDAFHFGSKTELDAFYAKCFSAVGTGADLASALTVTRPTEYQIVGPIDTTQSPTSAWDTTASASPYIFNCSIRSDYGLGGAFMDGAKVSGLKSMVCANFTGVSLQKDMSCWQRYDGTNWVQPTYSEYISTPPNSIRMNPARLSRHINAINDAFIQEVSVFAIGHGIHHFTDKGGEITVTNSNSSFGGCASYSKGYKTYSFPQDKNWSVGSVRVPLNLSEKSGNVRRIYLGTIESITSTKITLNTSLAADESSATVPALLLRDGYSLASGTKIWVENPTGAHWRADLTSSAWNSSAADEINITSQLTEAGTNNPVETNLDTGESFAIGKRVYIRRLVDTRTPNERRISIQLNNTASARIPERNFVLQTDPSRSGGSISRELASSGSEVFVISNAGVGPVPGPGVSKTSEVTIRRASPSTTYTEGTYYRSGVVVRYQNKHYQSLRNQTAAGSSPDPLYWGETFVHTASAYNPEDPIRNEAPILLIDTDTDPNDNTETCGINFTTVWTSAGFVRDQYRSGTDYLGAHAFLVALGFTSTAAHNALVPQAADNRDRNPSSSVDFPVAPSGGAATGLGNWAVEFRRPSVLRLYGHAWEWAGFLNYSKSIPAAQQDLSAQNKFTYYFTNEAGGRVVPQGSNEDGFNVTPRGLEDVETGATITVDQIGSSTLDDVQNSDFPNGLTASEITVDSLVINNSVDFPDTANARTTTLGVARLANIARLTATGANAITASTDAAIDAVPEVVTIGGLNRWRQAQRLISSGTETITIYVKSDAVDRNLNSMFDSPPTTAGTAIPTLARAAEYANSIIGNGNQTAEIRIAAGIYDPTSTWDCRVVFRACDSTNPQWPQIFGESIIGDAAIDNNYFDGSAPGNVSSRVNFTTFRILLTSSADNHLRTACRGRQMRFKRGVDFRGGFHFLGVPHLIRAVANGQITQSSILEGSLTLPPEAFTSDLSSNVNTLLNQMRIVNGKTAAYSGGTIDSPIVLEGQTTDVANLRSIAFGPALPGRKEQASEDYPYVATNGLARLRISNIYILGSVSISSTAIGVTNSVPLSGSAHYGSSNVSAPWIWRQTHHTFIGSNNNEAVFIERLGGVASYKQGSLSVDRTWFKNANTYLPNHIHLLTLNGEEPANDTDGPFFDQFIHASRSLSVQVAFPSTLAANSTGPITEGFVGRFGSNGYNSVKTRGVLLGNSSPIGPERGATVFLGFDTETQGSSELSRTIFKAAGISFADRLQSLPKYDIGSATFGEPNPVGVTGRKYNPVITTASLNAANGAFFLNMAIRSYAYGISPEYGFNITPGVAL